MSAALSFSQFETPGERAFAEAEIEHFEGVPQRAEALFALRSAMEFHEAWRIEFLAAGDCLAAALERSVTAHEQYERSGSLVEAATRLLAILKGNRP